MKIIIGYALIRLIMCCFYVKTLTALSATEERKSFDKLFAKYNSSIKLNDLKLDDHVHHKIIEDTYVSDQIATYSSLKVTLSSLNFSQKTSLSDSQTLLTRKHRSLVTSHHTNTSTTISKSGTVTLTTESTIPMLSTIITTISIPSVILSPSPSSTLSPPLSTLFDYTDVSSETYLVDTGNNQDNMQSTNVTCNEDEDPNCVIDHNVTCVGEPIYCNLTYDEYIQLLYDYIYPTTPEWICIFLHSIVFVMGLVGNALVCIAVYTNHSMRTVTNIFIVNLAVADFFVILFCLPPSVVWDVTETWFMGKAMCKVVLYFQNVSVTVSVLTLTFISIDRWYAICFPLRYVSTNERAIGSIAFIWLVAIVSDIPEFITLTTTQKQLRFGIKLFTQCTPTWGKETEWNFYVARVIMLYIFPLLLMTIAYFQIVRVLWKSDTIPGHRESRNHQQYTCGYLRNSCPPANSSTMGQLRTRRKAAKMLVAVVLMFAGCYFPVHALNVIRSTINIDQTEVIAVLSLFTHWLCYANSAVNPVIYNFMSGKFRREFKNTLEKCRCIGSSRGRVEDRSMYHSAPATRINNISPSSRSNYQLASVRDITRNQTLQTSFIENGGNGHHQMTPMLLDERLSTHTKYEGGP